MRLIESELRDLKFKLLDMAELVRLQIQRGNMALLEHNQELAERVLKKEREVDRFDNKIAKRCERIIALYQPVADDLRFVFSVLKINFFLENIGDQVSGICHKLNLIDEPFGREILKRIRLPEMQEAALELFADVINAYFQSDDKAAKMIFARDEYLDEINHEAFAIIVSEVQASPNRAADLIRLLHMVRNLEKIGDYCVAIAEEELFLSEGVMYRHSSEKHRLAQNLAELLNPPAEQEEEDADEEQEHVEERH